MGVAGWLRGKVAAAWGIFLTPAASGSLQRPQVRGGGAGLAVHRQRLHEQRGQRVHAVPRQRRVTRHSRRCRCQVRCPEPDALPSGRDRRSWASLSLPLNPGGSPFGLRPRLSLGGCPWAGHRLRCLLPASSLRQGKNGAGRVGRWGFAVAAHSSSKGPCIPPTAPHPGVPPALPTLWGVGG